MGRLSKSIGSLVLSAVGVALFPISAIASAVITGIAIWGAFFGNMMFNVPATRWVLRATIVLQAVAAHLLTGSVWFALGAFFLAAVQDAPNTFTLPALGSFGLTVMRLSTAAAGVACLVVGWPSGWQVLALLPLFMITTMSVLFSVKGLPEIGPAQ